MSLSVDVSCSNRRFTSRVQRPHAPPQFVVTFIFLIACLRSSGALISVFFFLTITVSSSRPDGLHPSPGAGLTATLHSQFILLAASEFTGNSNVHIAGGALGIM